MAVISVAISLYASMWAAVASLWAVFVSLICIALATLTLGVVVCCKGNALAGICLFAIAIACVGFLFLRF